MACEHVTIERSVRDTVTTTDAQYVEDSLKCEWCPEHVVYLEKRVRT